MSRAIVVRRFGGPENLVLEPRPAPAPSAGEVAITRIAAGIAYADILMREGAYPGGPQPPYVPGWDVAGRVTALGAGVDPSLLGRAVLALPLSGGYADSVVAPVERLVPIPDGVDIAQAAVLTLNYVTAWQLLHRAADIRPGQTILVTGAAGGIGSALIDLCRALGIAAIGIAAPAKAGLVESFGAIYAAPGQPLPAADAGFDGGGGAALPPLLSALRPGGVLVSYGFSAIAGKRLPLLPVLAHFARLRWLAWRTGRKTAFFRMSTLARREPASFRADLALLLDLLARGRIAPLIGGRFTLEEAASAHRLIEERRSTGKLLLVARGAADGIEP